MAVPLYQTATFRQPSAVENGPFDYTRSGNPTRVILEQNMAELEGGVRGLAFVTGMAAINAACRLVGDGAPRWPARVPRSCSDWRSIAVRRVWQALCKPVRAHSGASSSETPDLARGTQGEGCATPTLSRVRSNLFKLALVTRCVRSDERCCCDSEFGKMVIQAHDAL
jgi:Cys/Met metabolism PLP-dependent enzyme